MAETDKANKEGEEQDNMGQSEDSLDKGMGDASAKTSTGQTLKNLLFGRFANSTEEKLYQKYMRNQKLNIISTFVTTTVIYLISRVCLELLVFDFRFHFFRVLVHSTFIVLTIAALLFITYKHMSKLVMNLSILFLWTLVVFSLLFDVAVQRSSKTASKGVGWVQMVIFTTFVVVPWQLRWCVGLSTGLMVVYSMEELLLWTVNVHDEDEQLSHKVLADEVIANCLLFIGAILLGILVFVFSEKKQRRSFVESKKSHAISHQIEKEYKEQERLLLSVLPKHVADEMMQDMGAESSGQFRKIYMSRHENVSILFADIVGFTAISSSVTAAELVKILNQLFASFDDLANKYHQQRIKILGDCYYCVCGALDQRPDHAVLSIHMGMCMVDAISDVRQKMDKDVNMRVGIHTGSVLGGVLGQKQWQYDVLGKEVTLANHMESGGLPARVHISEATKKLLHGEFELEPGNGKERDEYLKMYNIQTYFIRSILKPYPEGTLDANQDNQAAEAPAKKTKKKRQASSPDMSGPEDPDVSQDVTLKEALLNRSRSREAMKQLNSLTTWFHDKEMEARYRQRREQFTGASMGALCVVFVLSFAAKLIVLPWTMITIFTFLAAEMVLVFMAVISSVFLLKQRLPRSLVRFGMAVDRSRVARMLWGVSAVLLLIVADSAMIMQCDIHRAREALLNGTHLHFLEPHDQACPYPSYFVHVVNLILLGVSSLVHIEHMTKLAIIVACTTIYSFVYIVIYGALFDFNDAIVYGRNLKIVPSKYQLSVQLVSASLALLVLNRKMEEISRRLFMWREEAEKQTRRATELRHKNEALVYNILPEHVARAFTGTHRTHTDLYSHAYDEAAVMFAACPNFHDFYSESAVNNEGLECLRFLNEIISDYDELLKRPAFRTVTKIKTVGPTYMAASGMVRSEGSSKETSMAKRWQHLVDLVQFALTMKEELTKINEQSFNNFILRIGIHQGPVIAGVIGALKPHYDIWGNTVNVASRMESTGMAGKIQVLEDTKLILEEFGYYFSRRGLVTIKGKGELVTYFLEGQDISKWEAAVLGETEELSLTLLDPPQLPQPQQGDQQLAVQQPPSTAPQSTIISGPPSQPHATSDTSSDEDVEEDDSLSSQDWPSSTSSLCSNQSGTGTGVCQVTLPSSSTTSINDPKKADSAFDATSRHHRRHQPHHHHHHRHKKHHHQQHHQHQHHHHQKRPEVSGSTLSSSESDDSSG